MSGEVLAAPTIIAVLQFLALSAIATDRFQTQHWIDGTWDSPVASPGGFGWHELNPVLADRPEMLDAYMKALEAVTLGIPRMLGPPWNIIALASWTAGALQAVARNNEWTAISGYPRYYVLAYRWNW